MRGPLCVTARDEKKVLEGALALRGPEPRGDCEERLARPNLRVPIVLTSFLDEVRMVHMVIVLKSCSDMVLTVRRIIMVRMVRIFFIVSYKYGFESQRLTEPIKVCPWTVE